MKTRVLGLTLAGLMALSLAGCGGTQATAEGDKAAATTTTTGDKVQLVFEYQKDRVSTDFEEVLESKFDVDIVMDENQSTDPALRLTNEVTHDMAPDFVLCEYIKRIDEDVLTNYFYNLSTESFVNNYYLNAIQACTASDGNLYYVPGPSYVYGIIYDKTAFAEMGLQVPQNYSEFAALLQQVKDMNLTGEEPDEADPEKMVTKPVEAFVPTMRWCDMSSLVFNTYNYEDSFRGVANSKWLADYQQGEGSMVGHLEPAAETYLQLFDDGVLSLNHFTTEPGYRSKKLYVYHTSLMTIESQQGYVYNQQINEENGTEAHEMGLMPIFTSDEPDSDYLYAIPRSFIAVTKQGAADPKKQAALMEIMAYLSTTEGQKLLIAGDDYFGFLKEETSLGSDFYTEVIDTINAGRIIPTFYFEGDNHGDAVETYMHDTTAELVNGTISVREWLMGADEMRDKAIAPKEAPEVFGEAVETLNPMQTAYVDGLAYLNSLKADIGFVPVSGFYGTQAYLYSGDITEAMMHLITTENEYFVAENGGNMDYVVAEMTGQEILDLANAVPDTGVAMLAGCEMTCDTTKEAGERYVSIKFDGQDLDPAKTYRVASMRGALGKARVVEEYPELRFVDMFKDYLKAMDGVVEAPAELVIVD
ncbi:MAG: extracellular solute-binding protein [Lachnospiraceae bacterium]|nr:extracellular solute-binding protein [Lachnospiraceae bacterium]